MTIIKTAKLFFINNWKCKSKIQQSMNGQDSLKRTQLDNYHCNILILTIKIKYGYMIFLQDKNLTSVRMLKIQTRAHPFSSPDLCLIGPYSGIMKGWSFPKMVLYWFKRQVWYPTICFTAKINKQGILTSQHTKKKFQVVFIYLIFIIFKIVYMY